MATPEPGKDEVVGWMERTGRNPIEAARHFYPGATDAEHKKLSNKFRQWKSRHKLGVKTRKRKAETSPTLAPITVERPAPRIDVAAMAQIERLEWQLAELGADIDMARSVGDYRGAAQVNKEITSVGEQLDRARARAARVSRKLERTPGAVAEALQRSQEQLAALAERKRRDMEARSRDL